MERRRERFNNLQGRLATARKTYRDARLVVIARHRERLHAFGERALRAIQNLLDNRDLRTERAGQLLTAFSYRGVLERGFALVRDRRRQPAAARRRRSRPARASTSNSRTAACARAAEGAPPLAPCAGAEAAAPAPRGGRDEGQGSLF